MDVIEFENPVAEASAPPPPYEEACAQQPLHPSRLPGPAPHQYRPSPSRFPEPHQYRPPGNPTQQSEKETENQQNEACAQQQQPPHQSRFSDPSYQYRQPGNPQRSERETEKYQNEACDQQPAKSKWPSPSLPDYLLAGPSSSASPHYLQPTVAQPIGDGFYSGQLSRVTVQPYSEVRNTYPYAVRSYPTSYPVEQKPYQEDECMKECQFWGDCCQIVCMCCYFVCEIMSHIK